MGQQQLILIVLCTIIIGVAIAVGIVIFSADAILAERDALIGDLTIVASNARAFYIRPSSMGGGNNSFFGYVLPVRLSSTENGTYTRAIDDAKTITFTGYSAANEDNYLTVKVTATDGKMEWKFYGEFDQ
jgi:hypothetical protein